MTRSPVVRAGLLTAIIVGTIAVAYFLGAGAGSYINERKMKEIRENTTLAVLNLMQTLEIGDTLSDHTFENLQQQTVRLTDMIHGRTLLMFLSPDCGKCLDEIEHLNNVIVDSSDFRSFVIISPSDRLDLLQARKLYDIRCPILWDRDNFYAGNLRIEAQPFNVLVDGSLVIERLVAGPLTEEEFEELVQ